jgi:hypothetical protein
VFKTKDHNLIPILSSIIGLFCSFTCTVYGFYIYNIKIIIPNIIGIALSLIQIAVWMFFYNYNKNKPQVSYTKFIDDTNSDKADNIELKLSLVSMATRLKIIKRLRYK